MSEQLRAAWALLPDYLSQHVILSASALALGLIISVPLAIAAIRSPRVRWPVLALASLVQTIPSLALLALFYPLLLALSALARRSVGLEFSALGFLPSLLALTLYSMLPIIRNGVTAVLHLDPAILEAARGVGMTRGQRLWRVELPLAVPMLMAGLRTAAVWVVGAATLSTAVGQTSLGNYIFSGLQLQNWVSVVFGCVVAAALALIVDQLLALIESGAAKRVRWRVAAGVAALVLGVGVGAAAQLGRGGAVYVIGAKNFSEQYILADVMAARLREQGQAVSSRVGLGSAVVFQALASNELDAYVDYTGTLWANVLKRSDTPSRSEVLNGTTAGLRSQFGVEALGPLGFENAYALAMRRQQAEELKIKTMADLARYAPELVIGGDFEFFARPEWAAMKAGYGLKFRSQREFQPTFMYKAVASGEVDVISAFSSDGRIAAEDLVVLEDPKQVVLPYDAVVLIAPRRIGDPVLTRALRPLIGRIPIDAMRRANMLVDRDEDKYTPEAAAQWLLAAIGLRAP